MARSTQLAMALSLGLNAFVVFYWFLPQETERDTERELAHARQIVLEHRVNQKTQPEEVNFEDVESESKAQGEVDWLEAMKATAQRVRIAFKDVGSAEEETASAELEPLASNFSRPSAPQERQQTEVVGYEEVKVALAGEEESQQTLSTLGQNSLGGSEANDPRSIEERGGEQEATPPLLEQRLLGEEESLQQPGRESVEQQLLQLQQMPAEKAAEDAVLAAVPAEAGGDMQQLLDAAEQEPNQENEQHVQEKDEEEQAHEQEQEQQQQGEEQEQEQGEEQEQQQQEQGEEQEQQQQEQGEEQEQERPQQQQEEEQEQQGTEEQQQQQAEEEEEEQDREQPQQEEDRQQLGQLQKEQDGQQLGQQQQETMMLQQQQEQQLLAEQGAEDEIGLQPVQDPNAGLGRDATGAAALEQRDVATEAEELGRTESSSQGGADGGDGAPIAPAGDATPAVHSTANSSSQSEDPPKQKKDKSALLEDEHNELLALVERQLSMQMNGQAPPQDPADGEADDGVEEDTESEDSTWEAARHVDDGEEEQQASHQAADEASSMSQTLRGVGTPPGEAPAGGGGFPGPPAAAAAAAALQQARPAASGGSVYGYPPSQGQPQMYSAVGAATPPQQMMGVPPVWDPRSMAHPQGVAPWGAPSPLGGAIAQPGFAGAYPVMPGYVPNPTLPQDPRLQYAMAVPGAVGYGHPPMAPIVVRQPRVISISAKSRAAQEEEERRRRADAERLKQLEEADAARRKKADAVQFARNAVQSIEEAAAANAAPKSSAKPWKRDFSKEKPKTFGDAPAKLAILMPYVANMAFSETLYYTCLSMWTNDGFADLLFLVEDQPLTKLPPLCKKLPNVRVIRFGKDGLAMQHVNKIQAFSAKRVYWFDELRQLFAKKPNQLDVFLPTWGHVFEDQLNDYTHWAWVTRNQMFGDLRRWVTQDELDDFDVVTYTHRRDVARLYLRRQWTLQQNTRFLNRLYASCDYLSSSIQKTVKGMASNIAEGCIMSKFLITRGVGVKFAPKLAGDHEKEAVVWNHGRLCKGERETCTEVLKGVEGFCDVTPAPKGAWESLSKDAIIKSGPALKKCQMALPQEPPPPRFRAGLGACASLQEISGSGGAKSHDSLVKLRNGNFYMVHYSVRCPKAVPAMDSAVFSFNDWKQKLQELNFDYVGEGAMLVWTRAAGDENTTAANVDRIR